MTNTSACESALSESGALSAIIPEFQVRPVQQQMAGCIENALHSAEKAIIEAGTGTGKTFAYLVPALLSNQKIIISTGTKNLQDQLYNKDLPIVHKALKSSKKTALLKGRSNYLCRYRLERNLTEGQFFTKQTVYELHTVQQWSSATKTGDIATCSSLAEDASVWSYVTSSRDNCLSQECPHFHKCYIKKAREKAQKADLLIVNHALFMADLALKEQGFGELLPGATSVIFDEAHQLPKIASGFFGETLTSRQIIELAQDIRREYLLSAKDTKGLRSVADKLKKTTQDCRLSFGVNPSRGTWLEIKNNHNIHNAIDDLLDVLTSVRAQLKVVKQRSKGLENCYKRSDEVFTKLKLLTSESDNEQIHWFETFKKHFSLSLTPMNISESFQSFMQHYEKAWVFTSATLSVANKFHYFSNQLGLNEAITLQLNSPFDFYNQAMLYLPKNLPNPSETSYVTRMVDAVIPVLNASKGRAFFLFTSFRALYEAEKLLASQLNYPLYVQGDKPKAQLLEEFRNHGNAVLLGTNSFWEGVNVRGEALSCVIIDKLPFASPTDPILKARITKLQQQGRNPFGEYQIPQAVISLKQGIGRLIRDQNDTGVMVICDPRLLTKSYGRIFLNSLPQMKHTRDVGDVERFF